MHIITDFFVAWAQSMPAARPSCPTDAIPRFYFPNKCPDPLMLQCQNEARDIDSFFITNDAGVSRADFQPITRILGFPSFFNDSLFDKVGPVDGLVTGLEVKNWWDDHCKHKDCETRLFELLRSEGTKYVTRQDWKLHLSLFLNTHPGLEFLKATPEFQERYLECVVERIYYTVNKADNGKLSLSEILKSNLVAVLRNLDEEPDINQVGAAPVSPSKTFIIDSLSRFWFYEVGADSLFLFRFWITFRMSISMFVTATSGSLIRTTTFSWTRRT